MSKVSVSKASSSANVHTHDQWSVPTARIGTYLMAVAVGLSAVWCAAQAPDAGFPPPGNGQPPLSNATEPNPDYAHPQLSGQGAPPRRRNADDDMDDGAPPPRDGRQPQGQQFRRRQAGPDDFGGNAPQNQRQDRRGPDDDDFGPNGGPPPQDRRGPDPSGFSPQDTPRQYRRQGNAGEFAQPRTMAGEEEQRPGERERGGMPGMLLRELAAELRELPTLDRHVRSLQRVMRDRNDLERRRRQVAEQPQASGGTERFRDFHELLREDDRMSSQISVVVDSMIQDLPKITTEIEARQRDWESKLSEERGGMDGLNGMPLARRRMAMLRTFRQKLQQLSEHPKQIEWLKRLVRSMDEQAGQPQRQPQPSRTQAGFGEPAYGNPDGYPPPPPPEMQLSDDDDAGPTSDVVRRRMMRISGELAEMKRRMRQLEEQLTDLQTLSDKATSAATTGKP